MTYGLNDIGLVPARISNIEHRSECCPYNKYGMLPLFTAPMNSIINEDNYNVFLTNKINTIIPRGVSYEKRLELSTQTFVALGLNEFEKFINEFICKDNAVYYICVDIANGHMQKLLTLCTKAKNIFHDRICLMAGNIANPDTYKDYAIAGIDFVRCGIGGGSACTTSANGGIHYGMASLIKDIADIKWSIIEAIKDAKALKVNCPYKTLPSIVADGGFDNYDKIIKALALGADYVMVGKLFAQCKEACGEVETYNIQDLKAFYANNEMFPKNYKWTYDIETNCYSLVLRKYYGMSTKKAQVETGKKELTTAEGIELSIPVLYTLSGWCDNFISYLRSAMSYTNSKDLIDFQESNYKIISVAEYISFYK